MVKQQASSGETNFTSTKLFKLRSY